ncbi:hypothetical protein KJ765_01875 [Candidatus Micrarchaeota archaeon]|nr:hypothetical protein [Candidatus Micrarchaeota archaeon]
MAIDYRKLLILLVVSALLVRVLPLSLSSFPDPDHYYHLRITSDIVQQNRLPAWDALSFQGRVHTYYPLFHMIMASFALLTNLPVYYAYALVSLLVAGAGVIAVFSLSIRILGNERTAFFAALLFAFLPGVLIRSMAFTRPDSLSLLLIPVMLLFLMDRKWVALGCLALFLGWLHPFTSIIAGGLVVLFVGNGFLEHQRIAWKIVMAYGLPWVVGVLYYVRFPLDELVLGRTFATSSELQPLEFDFAFLALGIVWVFLGIAWMERRRFSVKHRGFWFAWLVISFLMLLLAPRASIFIALPAVIFAAPAVVAALKRSAPFQPVLLGILAVSISLMVLVFSTGVQGQYSREAVSAAEWLSVVPEEQGVLSAWDRGHLITYASGRKVFMDGYFEFADQLDARHAIVLHTFQFPDADAWASLREKNVRYVFIDGDLFFDSLVFSDSVEHLGAANRILDNGGAQIYQGRVK